jgi:hypothetical protein
MEQMKYLGSEKHKKAVSKGGQVMAIRQKQEAEKRITEYNKNPKKCLQCGNPIFHKSGGLNETLYKKFCSLTCSAFFSNSHKKYKPSEDNRTKEIKCVECDKKIVVRFTVSEKTTRCLPCREKRLKFLFQQYKEKYKLICTLCGHEFFSSTDNKKYCIPCGRKIKGRKAGLASAKSQAETRRSKNEIYFAEL